MACPPSLTGAGLERSASSARRLQRARPRPLPNGPWEHRLIFEHVSGAFSSHKAWEQRKTAPETGPFLVPDFGPKKVRVHCQPSPFSARKRGPKTAPIFGSVRGSRQPLRGRFRPRPPHVLCRLDIVPFRSAAPSVVAVASRPSVFLPSPLVPWRFCVESAGISLTCGSAVEPQHQVVAFSCRKPWQRCRGFAAGRRRQEGQEDYSGSDAVVSREPVVAEPAFSTVTEGRSPWPGVCVEEEIRFPGGVQCEPAARWTSEPGKLAGACTWVRIRLARFPVWGFGQLRAPRRPFVFAGIMPKRRKRSKAPADDGEEWVEHTARRLHHYTETVRDLQAPAAEAAPGRPRDGSRSRAHRGASAGREPPRSDAPPSPRRGGDAPPRRRPSPPSEGVVPPEALPMSAREEFSQMRITEKSALSFAPSRRAVMICGRPVVAPSVGAGSLQHERLLTAHPPNLPSDVQTATGHRRKDVDFRPCVPSFSRVRACSAGP